MTSHPSNDIRILITGGSGFIGTNLIDYYLAKNITVVNLDCQAPRKKTHQHLWQNVNLLDRAQLQAATEAFDPTHVVHLAARTDLDENRNLAGYDANTTGVENLLNALRGCKKLKRCIFTSSMLVCKVGYSPAHYDDYCPPNLYGQSKVIGEQLVKNENIDAYEWLLIRPTSIWGPWFGAPYRDFFLRVRNKRYFKLGGDASTKTFGFVFNAVFQIDQLLFAPPEQVHKKTFYIGDTPPLNINDWAERIARALNMKLPTIPMFVFKSAGLVGDVLSLLHVRFPLTSFRVKNMTTNNVVALLDDTKAVVPDTPYSLDEGIAITLAWLNEHLPYSKK